MNLGALWAHTAAAAPLIHTITNPVTVNDCANVILAAGGAPTMAQHEREAAEIAASADALVLGMGALRAEDAMLLAGGAANARHIPVSLDPVAVGASAWRREVCRGLLERVRFSVIRGNASEIYALAEGRVSARGVEVSERDRVTEDNLEATAALLQAFARQTGAVIVLSGAIDLVSDDTHTAVVRNGCARMSRITGAGCMLTALIGTVIGANAHDPFGAALAAVCAFGMCGEIADERVQAMGEGSASFRMRLIDAVSLLTEDTVNERARFTVR